MKLSLTITCDCGNTETYNVEYKYHSASAESFIDLSEAISDDKFHAKPTPDGMWINCRKCGKGFEVI